MKIMRFSDNNKEKQLRRIKSTVTQSQVQESNDGHPLGKMLSGKMLAPSPAFQKALMGWYFEHSNNSLIQMTFTFKIFLGIADQKKENEDFSYDDIDWDTLPEEINHTRSHVQSLLGNRFGRRQSLDDSVVGIKVNNSRRRRGALDALGMVLYHVIILHRS